MAPERVNLPDENLEWIQMREESVFAETSKEKLLRKIKENPIVPLGKTHLILI